MRGSFWPMPRASPATAEDFSAASDELAHLHWLPLPETRHLDLPFITEVVLAEVADLLARQARARPCRSSTIPARFPPSAGLADIRPR